MYKPSEGRKEGRKEENFHDNTDHEMMRLPGPIYESLPYLYFIGALLSIILIGTPLSLFSAVLLTYAAWMVWKSRKDYRSYMRYNQSGQY